MTREDLTMLSFKHEGKNRRERTGVVLVSFHNHVALEIELCIVRQHL